MLLFELEKPAMVSVPVKVDMMSRNPDEAQSKNEDTEKDKKEYDDNSVAKLTDTRKTRLTLEQINKLRILKDQKIAEYSENIKKVKQQFSAPAEAPA
tara:strand:+ start:37 stop:327 length:291 start_codon:yes stop_codon:yes gene_type:complete